MPLTHSALRWQLMGAVVFQKKYSFREYLAASMMVRPPDKPPAVDFTTHSLRADSGRSVAALLTVVAILVRALASPRWRNRVRACACAYFGNRRSAAYLLRIAEGCTGRT
jgi:hypothetical protein